MRVEALAVAAGTVAVAAFRHMPVAVAVGSVAVLAESGIVVEPGGVDLGEGQGRPERLSDLLRPAGIDGITHVPVLGSDALDDEMPSFWLTMQEKEALPPTVPPLPLRWELSRRH